MKKKIRFYKALLIEIIETLCTICLYFEKDGEYFPQNTPQANREERITSPKSRKVCEKYSLVAKKGRNLGKNLKQLCEIHSLVKIYHDTLPEKCGFRSLEDITSCGRRSLVSGDIEVLFAFSVHL